MSANRVIVGMSGGVDSSVSASLLIEQGYDVVGLFMKNWEEDDGTDYCTAAEDLADAQSVCDHLGINLKTVNFATEYWDRVFEEFLDELKKGRTPNPDILCNREIKFREFLSWSEKLGGDLIATGHYANTRVDENGARLLRGLDKNKDQSYFLYQVPGAALTKTLFPIGAIEKTEVRERAQALGLSNHSKKDSTGICFIGERRFREFLKRYLPPNPGEMHTAAGESVGQHHGLMYYTIGQRHGLGIGGPGEAWYVAGKDIEKNILTVVQGHDHPALMSSGLSARELYWIHRDDGRREPRRCTVKTRYRQHDVACSLTWSSDGSLDVVFDEPQRAVTPGQSVVFYDNEICLGGGIIDVAVAAYPESTASAA